MAFPKVGLFLSAVLGLFVFAAISKPAAASTSTVPAKLPDKLSTDPATALTEVIAAYGAPIQTSEGQQGASGRKYDVAVFKNGNTKLVMIHSVVPASFFIGTATYDPTDNFNVNTQVVQLVNAVPDDVASSDIHGIFDPIVQQRAPYF